MSMMSEKFLPSACEVDVTGVLTMYAMQLAGGTPAALVDWNNNYADDDDKCVLFHCGNWAKSFLPDIKISTAPILGSILGVENTYGALDGRTPGRAADLWPHHHRRCRRQIRTYVGEGELTNDKLDTFGNRAVAKIPHLQKLMHHVCKQGFEHHVVMTHRIRRTFWPRRSEIILAGKCISINAMPKIDYGNDQFSSDRELASEIHPPAEAHAGSHFSTRRRPHRRQPCPAWTS